MKLVPTGVSKISTLNTYFDIEDGIVMAFK